MTRLVFLIAWLALLCGCAVLQFVGQFDCSQAYVDARYANSRFTSYSLGPFQRTPSGIQVNPSGQVVNFNQIDAMTAELETCLQVPIKRCGVRVTIAPNSRYVPSSGAEVFPCRIGSGTGPQFCYGVVEYPATAVVAADLRALKHELIHLVLHVEHSDSRFARCQGDSRGTDQGSP